MRATRRRQRRPDPLALPSAVRSILDQLRSTLPEIVPRKEKDLICLLRAARHIQRYPATDTKRGRPSRWSREDLLKVTTKLASILDRETPSRISVGSFIDHYLRLLNFPADVIAALNKSEINLSEAAQLARINSDRINSTTAEAKRIRVELLSTHMQTNESGPQLRSRVNEFLRASSNEAGVVEAAELAQDLEDFDPYDSTHLFWDQIKQLGFALRDIRHEDVMDEEIDELLKASEPVLTILARIQRRKERITIKKIAI